MAPFLEIEAAKTISNIYQSPKGLIPRPDNV